MTESLISNMIQAKATFPLGALSLFSKGDWRFERTGKGHLSADVNLDLDSKKRLATVAIAEGGLDARGSGFGSMTIFSDGSTQLDYISVDVSAEEWRNLVLFRANSPATIVELFVVGGSEQPPDDIIGGHYAVKIYSLNLTNQSRANQ